MLGHFLRGHTRAGVRLKNTGAEKTVDEIKTFVNLANKAVIICPACGVRKTVQVDKFKSRKHSLKVKCPCGHSFSVHLDFRKHYRKTTDLEGFYAKKQVDLTGYFINLTQGDEWQDDGRISVNCMIKNLSMGGIGMVLIGNSVVKEDDELRVCFTLDNKKKTLIDRTVVVVSVTPYLIGCQFAESIAHDKDLGFYLMP